MNNLLIEIKRNLELMGVGEKPIILEQKQISDAISDLIRNAIRGVKAQGEAGRDIINFGGRETTLEQLEGLLDRMRKFDELNPSSQIETLGLLDNIFPDKVTKSFFDEFIPGGEKDLLYAVSQHSPKIKTIEQLKDWLYQNGLKGPDEADFAANILGDKFLKRADDYGRHLEELETNPKAEFDGFTTDEAKVNQSERIDKASDTGRGGDDVTDAGRAGDDIDTPNPSRTEKGPEREIVSDKDIDPNDRNYTTDGRRIIYNADGNPTAAKKIETIEPKDPEPIETPDPTGPELRTDSYGKLSEVTQTLRDSGNKFVKKNKKEFDELDKLLNDYENKSLSLSEKQQIKKEIEKLSKKLTSRWKRTFINKKEIEKFIKELKSIEGELSSRDKNIVNEFISVFKNGIEGYLNSVSSFRKLLMLLRGAFRGIRDVKTDWDGLSSRILRKIPYVKKMYTTPLDVSNKNWVDTAENILALPQIRTKTKRLNDALRDNSNTYKGEAVSRYIVSLAVGWFAKVAAIASLSAFIKAALGRYINSQVADKLKDAKDGKTLSEEEIQELKKHLSYLTKLDYDEYIDSEGKDVALYNILFNFFDELDPNNTLGWIPTINRLQTVGEVLSYVSQSELGSSKGSDSMNSVDEWIDKITNAALDGSAELEDMLNEVDVDNLIPVDKLVNELEVVQNYIEDFEAEGMDLTQTSWDVYSTTPLLKTQYSSEALESMKTKDFFDKYVLLKNGKLTLKTNSGKNITFKKADAGAGTRWYFSVEGRGDDLFKFDNEGFRKSKLKPVSEWTTQQNENIIGLISVLLEQVDDEFGPSEQERIEQERSEREESSNGTSENDGSSTSSESENDGSSTSSDSEDNNESELDAVLRAARGGDKIKSKGGNFTYLKDDSDKIKSDIKTILNGARNDARRPHRDAIHVTLTNPSDYNSQKVVLAGTSEVDGSEVQYDIEKDPSGVEWGWIDNTGDEKEQSVWKSFSEYKNRQ
jgi:hypothetical protein